MMQLTLPPRSLAHDTLRALSTVARADGELHPSEQRLIELVAEALDVPYDGSALEPIEPEELAAKMTEPDVRRGFVTRLVVLTTLDGEVTEDEVSAVEHFAAALDVEERAIRNLRQLAQGYARLVAFDLGRRSFLPKLVRGVWREQGIRGLWKIAMTLAGRTDEEEARRFEALAELPEGTLGHTLFDHFVDNSFPYPGQKGGVPARFLFHDLGHVLTGYGTTPDQELLAAGFQAGYMGGDGVAMYLMIAMLFQLAVEPVAKMRGVEPRRELLDIEAFMEAVERGRTLAVDLMDWDPWPHMARPLHDVRIELGLS